MNNSKNSANHHVVCESIEAHLDRFIAGLKAEGYASGSISTKRAALRRFLQWRRRRKPPGSEPDESEVVQFLARSSRLGPAHRCLASTALFAFLKYLRWQGVISSSAPEAPETISSAMEKRYEDFLRNDKGLAESSLRVYLPLVGDLLGYLQKRNGGNSVRRLDAGVLRAFLFDRTHASRILQQGASLRDISEILRHRSPTSTEIYAKIDMRSLNEVIRPWPKKGGPQ